MSHQAHGRSASPQRSAVRPAVAAVNASLPVRAHSRGRLTAEISERAHRERADRDPPAGTRRAERIFEIERHLRRITAAEGLRVEPEQDRIGMDHDPLPVDT